MDNAENQVEISFSTDKIKDIILELNGRREEYQSYQKELKESGETQKSLTDPDSKLMKLHVHILR